MQAKFFLDRKRQGKKHPAVRMSCEKKASKVATIRFRDTVSGVFSKLEGGRRELIPPVSCLPATLSRGLGFAKYEDLKIKNTESPIIHQSGKFVVLFSSLYKLRYWANPSLPLPIRHSNQRKRKEEKKTLF